MRRQDKYPETDTFVFYNANPKNRITGDCVYRALSTVTGIDYATVVREQAEIAIRTGYSPASDNCVEDFLVLNGFLKFGQPRKKDNTKYTGKEFCEYLNKNKPQMNTVVFCSIGSHHSTAITPKDGKYKIHDIWNCSCNRVGKTYYKFL